MLLHDEHAFGGGDFYRLRSQAWKAVKRGIAPRLSVFLPGRVVTGMVDLIQRSLLTRLAPEVAIKLRGIQ